MLAPSSDGRSRVRVVADCGEEIVNKVGVSAFQGTQLDTLLRHAHVRDVIVAGASPTWRSRAPRQGFDLGYRMTVVRDACCAPMAPRTTPPSVSAFRISPRSSRQRSAGAPRAWAECRLAHRRGLGAGLGPVSSPSRNGFMRRSVHLFDPDEGHAHRGSRAAIGVHATAAEAWSRSQLLITLFERERSWAVLDECRTRRASGSPPTVLDLSPISASVQTELPSDAARLMCYWSEGVSRRSLRAASLAARCSRTTRRWRDPSSTGARRACDEVVPTGAVGSAKMLGMLVDLLVGRQHGDRRRSDRARPVRWNRAERLVRLVGTGSGANAVLARPATVDDFRALRAGLERALVAAQRPIIRCLRQLGALVAAGARWCIDNGSDAMRQHAGRRRRHESALDIGVIGLAEWRPMAQRLAAAGHSVSGYDISADALAAARRDGVEPMADPATLAERCELVIAMVWDDHALRDVVCGARGSPAPRDFRMQGD
jgi:hypothetical protein